MSARENPFSSHRGEGLNCERERRVGNVVRHWMAKEREKRKSSIHNREHYSLSEFFQILFLFLSFFFSFIAPFWKAEGEEKNVKCGCKDGVEKTENVPFTGFIHKWWQRYIIKIQQHLLQLLFSIKVEYGVEFPNERVKGGEGKENFVLCFKSKLNKCL